MRIIRTAILFLALASSACAQKSGEYSLNDIEVDWEKELTVPSGKNSLSYKVYYGKTGRDIRFYEQKRIRDIHHPSKIIKMRGNETHVVIVKYGDQEPVYFPMGSVSIIEVFPQIGDDATSSVLCSFDKPLKLSGVFLGSEDGGGILHYDKGWKWHQCSD